MNKRILLMGLLATATTLWAQGPNNSGTYYKAADGKKGEALKTALYKILRGNYINGKAFTVVSYKGLFDAYTDTDLRPDGYIWDMYSNTTNYYPSSHQGSYSKEGDMYNREHSVPASWFDDASPMYSDLFHVYPTDGYVNNRRSNYPFGKVATASYKSNNNFSKLGSSATTGYAGTVFEPNDLYKGDFARTYFYMVTCYQDKSFTKAANGAQVFDGTTYPGMKTWALNMFMEWADGDPVSDKEYNRNNAVAGLQHNRNPFIDYPGLEQYIWGSMKDVAFSYDNYQTPEGTSPYVPGDDPGDDPIVDPTPSEGEFLYKRVASSDDLEVGASYLVVCESCGTAMAEQGNNIRNYVSLTANNGTVTTGVNEKGKPYELTLGTANGHYTLYDATEKVYLAHTKAENKLHTATTTTAASAQWDITFSGDNANIQNLSTDYYILYNKSAPRFSCYKSGQQPVMLYKRQPEEQGNATIMIPMDAAKQNTIIHDMQGRRVATTANGRPRLQKGVYIIGKKKVIIK